MPSPEINEILSTYNPDAPLERARTIPSAWYTDPRMLELEKQRVFGRGWQAIGRVDQVQRPGEYLTANVAGEPVVVIRGQDGLLRAFFNVCRHHAAEVATHAQSRVATLQCPYHGWTYALDGSLKAVPEFDDVCDFDRAAHGLVPLRAGTWEHFVFVSLDHVGVSLEEYLGDLVGRVTPLNLARLRFVERRSYELACNWKVFVDNYLDGGYHVPFIHKGLGSVLSYKDYAIENGARYCIQSSPMNSRGGDAETAAVRRGDTAYYIWLYPNFMVNCYEGYLDTNLVLPLAVNRTRVIFDFYFPAGNGTDAVVSSSVTVADRIQEEDIDVCESVQRGLGSRAYDTGRLSVSREAGEQLFHRLLHADLTAPP